MIYIFVIWVLSAVVNLGESTAVCPTIDGEDSVYFPVTDCTKFCQCSNGDAYLHDCPQGLHFNPTLNVCDWPEDAGCATRISNSTIASSTIQNPCSDQETSTVTQVVINTTTTSTTTQGVTESSNICVEENIVCPAVDGQNSVYFPVSDCTKFCQCSNGAAYEHDCPAGLHFNSKLNVCDWPEDAGCDSSATNTTTTQAATEATKTTTTSSATQAATNTTTTLTTTQAATEASNICVDENIVCSAVDGENSVYFPVSDCTKFCQCSNGVAYEHDCLGGLHFNSNLKVCDWPEDAGCDSGATNTTTTQAATEATKTTTQAATNTTTTSTTTQAVTDASNICVDENIVCPAVDGEDSVYFPVSDCTKFCQCSNGVAYEHDCPGGLHFNSNLNVCDWPEDAGCDSGVNKTTTTQAATEATETTTTSSATQAATNTTTTSTTTHAVTEASNICVEENIVCPAVDGEDSVYFPVSDCTKFCQCSNGVAYEHDCPGGLHFNSNLNVCDWPEDAGCDSGATNTTTTQASTEASKTTTTSSATQGATNTTTTSTTTQAVTEASNICVDENIVCPEVDGEDSVYFPVSDCTKFCQCSNGVAYEHDCPGGLHFNSNLNVCDWPEDAGCDSGATNTTTTQAATEATNKTTTSSATHAAINTTTTSTTTQAVTDASNICVDENILCPVVDGEDSVYFPVSDCTKFCQCSNGVAYEHDCPGGLHFNSNLNVCDWPEDAGCDSLATNTTTTQAATEATNKTTTSSATQAATNTTTKSTTTQAVTESSNICVEENIICPEVDGENSVYFPISDCTKFCQCSNGAAYEHDCPGGLHFNSNLNVCDWPEDAGCDSGVNKTTTTQAATEAIETTTTSSATQAATNTTTKSTTTQAVTESSNICVEENIICPEVDGENSVYFPISDCTKFCQCSNGAAYEHDCPGGLHFNSNLYVCDWPEDAGCDRGVNKTTTTQAATETIKTTTTSSATQAVINTTTTSTTTQSVTEASNICVKENIVCPAVDGEDSVYFPVSDCTKFCQCSNGVAYEHDCPGGLHFNSHLNVCDWPEDAGCDSGATNTTTTQAATEATKTTTTSSTTQAGTNTSTISPTTHAVTEASNICVKENIVCPAVIGEDSVYFPVADCTKFCQCSNEVAYEHDCPGGLHFNSHLNVCDWPEDAGCDSGAANTTTTQAATETTKTTTTSSATQAATNTSTISQTTHAVTEASNICADENIVCPAVDGEDSVYFPVSDCTKFCQCSNGVAYEHDCPGGLHFNSHLNVCDWPEDAGCDSGATNTTTTQAATEAIKTTTTSSATQAATNTTTTSTTTQAVTEASNICVDENIVCPAVDGEDSVYFPVSDCTKFCQCSNGVAYEHDCPGGLHFNSHLNVCDWPEDAGCDSGATNTTTTQAATEASKTTTTSSATQAATNTTTTSTTTQAVPEASNICVDENIVCPAVDGEDSVYFPVSVCTKFCQCSNGAAYEHDCPTGLHFNSKLNVCDWPEDAECDGGSTS